MMPFYKFKTTFPALSQEFGTDNMGSLQVTFNPFQSQASGKDVIEKDTQMTGCGGKGQLCYVRSDGARELTKPGDLHHKNTRQPAFLTGWEAVCILQPPGPVQRLPGHKGPRACPAPGKGVDVCSLMRGVGLRHRGDIMPASAVIPEGLPRLPFAGFS